MKRFCLVLCLNLLIGFSAQKSTPNDINYVAAVVEYLENANSTENLINYVQLIQDAAFQNADIIVFPELTLTLMNHIVVPFNSLLKDYPIPALAPTLYDKVLISVLFSVNKVHAELLVSISSAAMENEIYVVINVEELLDCTSGEVPGENCPESKAYIFNTNVVFDQTGAVIDRYRKINLFGEATRTRTFLQDLGIFNTDFGVTFGHFISFDLLFQVPAIQMVQKYNLTDIIFPVRWFSEMPYLSVIGYEFFSSAVSIQQAYAFTMNANFLAAGANDVRVGMSGSGIYSGKSGALVSVITGIPTTRLLVASVPKVPGQVIGAVQGPLYNEPSDQDRLHLTTDKSLPLHTTRILSPGTQYDFTLINKDVICFFHLKFNERNAVHRYRYRAAAFSGVRTYDRIVSGGSRICSIFACTNDTIESCGQRFPQYSPNSTAVFEALNITAGVPIPETDEALSAKTATYFPVTLDTTLMPLKPAHYIFEETNELLDLYRVYMFNLRNLDAELYSFGIWGREYTTDREDEEPIDSTEPSPDPNSSILHRLHTLLLLFAIVALLL